MADRFRTDLDWEDVRFFVALARHRSLSATARALGVNHAAGGGVGGGARGGAVRAPALGYALTSAGQGALEAAGSMESAAEALPRLQATQKVAGLLRRGAVAVRV